MAMEAPELRIPARLKNRPHICPQPGPQTQFLQTSADMAVFGGAAGGGKTWALLVDAARFVHIPGYGAVVFRREFPQIRAEGGLWDESQTIYRRGRGVPREGYCDWTFPKGTKIRFAHMQREDDRFSWDGSQIPFIGFDQLESFTWKQFIYLLSRNRSQCGVLPTVRATCNPDPDHWLREFLRWWIDDDSGLPIYERSGVIRWFINLRNEIHWADSPEELKGSFSEDVDPKSFTFIPSRVQDNKILLHHNPGYIASLEALPYVDRERLLNGNWNIRESAGTIFQRRWFPTVDAAPQMKTVMRYWDRAGTEEAKASAHTSYTAGVKMGQDASNRHWILDVVRFRGSPLEVASTITNVASQDGRSVKIGIEQDPGQAGKAEAQSHLRNLAGYDVAVNAVHESKGVRAKPVSAQAEAGNILVLRGAWNNDYLQELENFDGSSKCVSDQTDATSGAFMLLNQPVKRAGAW